MTDDNGRKVLVDDGQRLFLVTDEECKNTYSGRLQRQTRLVRGYDMENAKQQFRDMMGTQGWRVSWNIFADEQIGYRH